MDPNTPLAPQPTPQPMVAIQAKKPFWKSTPYIIILLVLVWPLGLLLMWLSTPWKKWLKIVLTLVVLLIYLVPTALFFYYVYLIATHQPLPNPAAQSIIQSKSVSF